MKSTFIGILIIFFVFSSNSCKNKNEICECFEIRLEIKKLINESDDLSELVETEEYKSLKEKKTECLINIEPQYFEERNIHRKGRNDKTFLLEEVGNCDAVKELLGVDKETE